MIRLLGQNAGLLNNALAVVEIRRHRDPTAESAPWRYAG